MPMPVSATDKITVRLVVHRRRDPDLAALGELQRVGDEIPQGLRDLPLVGVQGGQTCRLFEDQGDGARTEDRPHHPRQRREELDDLEIVATDGRLAGLDPRDVQQVVDQVGEGPGGLPDEGDLGPLLAIELPIAAVQEQGREREDGVDRGAELVGHVGQEPRFQLTGAAERGRLVIELGIEGQDAVVGLGELALGAAAGLDLANQPPLDLGELAVEP